MSDRIYGDFPAPHFSGPDADGWYTYAVDGEDSFVALYGPMRLRRIDDARALVRVDTHAGFSNQLGGIHGGFLLAFVDQVLFAGPSMSGLPIIGGATVDVTAQFLAPGQVGRVLEAETEILRETKRLVFVRGLLRQDGETKLAFTGTIRKPGP